MDSSSDVTITRSLPFVGGVNTPGNAVDPVAGARFSRGADSPWLSERRAGAISPRNELPRRIDLIGACALVQRIAVICQVSGMVATWAVCGHVRRP